MHQSATPTPSKWRDCAYSSPRSSSPTTSSRKTISYEKKSSSLKENFAKANSGTTQSHARRSLPSSSRNLRAASGPAKAERRDCASRQTPKIGKFSASQTSSRRSASSQRYTISSSLWKRKANIATFLPQSAPLAMKLLPNNAKKSNRTWQQMRKGWQR